MTARIHENRRKGIFFIILFIVLMLQTLITGAQPLEQVDQNLYRGFVASFGIRSIDLSSNIEQIDQTSLLQAGGHVGLIFGNSIVRSKIGLLGYYSSTGNTAGTTDLYESNVVVNFYPLSWLVRKSFAVEPYMTGGLDYNLYKFYGHYINQDSRQTNYSQAEAPYIGKIKQLNATIGTGIEVKFTCADSFVHLFSEVRCGENLSSRTSNTALSNTKINNQTQVILGISFGAHRL